MERRVLLAVLLSFLVLYAYQALFPSPPEPGQKSPQASKVATAPNASAPESPNPKSSIAAPTPTSASPATAAVETAPARDVTIDTPDVHGVFTTRGGVLRSWELKKYRDPSGHPLELIAGHAPADAPLPFTLALDDPQLSSRLAVAPFALTASSTPSNDNGAAWHVQFDYSDASGVHVTKMFAGDHAKPYVISVSVSVTQNGQSLPATLRWGPAIASGIVPKSRSYNPPSQAIFYKDGKVSRLAPAKITQQPVQDGAFGFAGVDDHYFLVAVVKPAQPLKVEYSTLDAPVEGYPEGAHYVSWSARYPTPPQAATYFAGPKDFDVLAAVDRDLVRAIDFGMFAWLVVPLLRALKWINGYVGNYGWSLIILTVLINLAMFPLRHKSVVSMRKMQEIQPEVKAIQDRYAKLKVTDPARAKMNQEMMALYKERGVNPASGCVPMLLMFPVLFAFYALLGVAIELRGAPFIGWIHDLSAPDPHYVLPVLMGISMFIQQKMTPSSPDPTQQRMMLVMPVVLTGMSLWWASGLLLYWTTSNVWGILQQMITNRLIGPAQVRTVRPPAERQLKRVGGGRTDRAAKERD